MFKKIVFLVTAAVATVWTGMAVPTITEARTIKVGMECTYPPYNFRDSSGKLAGFEVDLIREFAVRFNHQIEYVCQEWKGILPGLLAGKYDVIISTLSITPKREKQVDFTISYRASTGRFIARKGANLNPFNADGSPNLNGLMGKAIGVQKSTTYTNYLKAEFKGLRLKQYDSFHSVLLDLQAGRLDAVLHGPIKLDANFLKKPEGKDFEFVGPELTEIKYFGKGVGAAVAKGRNGDIVKDWNDFLSQTFQDGFFKKTNLEYWDFSILPEVWQ